MVLPQLRSRAARLLALLAIGVGVPLQLPTAAWAQAGAAGSRSGVDTTNFDRATRPQDDFNQFVNGAWLAKTAIPPDRSRWGAFDELRDRSEAALREIIEEAAGANAAAGSEQQKVGDFYRSFMDTARVEAHGLEPLRAELDAIATVTSRSELAPAMARLARIGVRGVFSAFVGQDQKNSSAYIVSLSQGGLGMPDRDYYLREGERFDEIRAAYRTYVMTLLGLAEQPDPAGAADRVIALETRIAERHWDRARSRDRDATYNKMTVTALAELTPSFDWDGYREAAGVGQASDVVVRQPDYLQALDTILVETPTATWREYLTYKLLDRFAEMLPQAFVEAQFAFDGRVLAGLEEMRPRWKRGIDAVEEGLGEAVGKLYVARHFRPEAKARMDALVRNLLAAFREGIDELEWMGPTTKGQAQDKLAKFTVKIGYPDTWRDYGALEVRADDLIGNEMRASRFAYDEMTGRLGQPVDRTRWGMTPQTVNAYYSSTNNEIVFPAAILQPPFFDLDADDAVNYGAIGAVIGHEISHGFDDQGSKSDGDGNLRNWFTAEDLAAFQARTGKLTAQYAAYNPIDDLYINGQLTLGENIGDLSGLAVAHRAYRMSLRGTTAPVIDGFTGDQRFFLGWGQIWRTKIRDDALRRQLLTDPHSPGAYRARVPLTNMKAFYEAWGVKEGDGMYRQAEERVKVW